MNKKAFSLIAGVVFVALNPCVATAFEIPKTGYYVGLGLDLVEESFKKYDNGKGFKTGVGFILTGGNRFYSNLAIEGSCEYLKRLNSKDRDISILAFNGNLKGYLTTLRFQPFVLIGIGVTRFNIKPVSGGKKNKVGLSAHIGGGVDYYLSPEISVGITVAYVGTSGKIKKREHTTIGLGAQYRF